jgi:hypothetical protein
LLNFLGFLTSPQKYNEAWEDTTQQKDNRFSLSCPKKLKLLIALSEIQRKKIYQREMVCFVIVLIWKSLSLSTRRKKQNQTILTCLCRVWGAKKERTELGQYFKWLNMLKMASWLIKKLVENELTTKRLELHQREEKKLW